MEGQRGAGAKVAFVTLLVVYFLAMIGLGVMWYQTVYLKRAAVPQQTSSGLVGFSEVAVVVGGE